VNAIFALLPLDQRLRCREVAVAWRDFLDGSDSLWRELGCSAFAMGVPRSLSAGLVLALAKQAAGRAHVLDLTGCLGGVDEQGACGRRLGRLSARSRRSRPAHEVALELRSACTPTLARLSFAATAYTVH
jgi:hypothetical protein